MDSINVKKNSIFNKKTTRKEFEKDIKTIFNNARLIDASNNHIWRGF
ncbi:hypothetical protein GF327_02080 [Candidatus Woesearchaeota archaeon]|nr:hypothetical protein [Candidatus Woesearchaeota archaeon]